MHAKHAAQALAATKTGCHTRAVPRCSARSVCADASLAMRAPASVRSTAKQEFHRRCSKAMHAEHADGDCAAAPSVTRCRQRVPVAIECVIDGHGAARKHQRVLRASPCCICYEILALRCRGPMLAHALAGRRRRTRFWRYTLARRMYGAPFWLRPTAALRVLRASPFGICAEILPWPASPAQSLIPRVITAAIGTAIPSAVRNSAAFASMSAMMAGIAAGS